VHTGAIMLRALEKKKQEEEEDSPEGRTKLLSSIIHTENLGYCVLS
jgi:hypothetical protein